MNEPPSIKGYIALIHKWLSLLFTNNNHNRLVKIACYFLRRHWENYKKLKLRFHGHELDEYYSSIMVLRANWNSSDDDLIKRSIRDLIKVSRTIKKTE